MKKHTPVVTCYIKDHYRMHVSDADEQCATQYFIIMLNISYIFAGEVIT